MNILFFADIRDDQEKTMKYESPQCDNVFNEKKEHIEEVHVKQEKGNLLKFK